MIMMTIPADDDRAVTIVTAIQGGDVETLRRHLRDSPDFAVARIVDSRGVSRTLLHIAADSCLFSCQQFILEVGIQ